MKNLSQNSQYVDASQVIWDLQGTELMMCNFPVDTKQLQNSEFHIKQ
jgi:hypothetical protein